jgi:hypothetical protein
LGGIQSALTAIDKVSSLAGLMDQSKGVAASAFNAIKNSFKPFKAGVPQNLTQIAKENAAAAAEVANQDAQAGTKLLNEIGSTAGKSFGAFRNVTGTLSSFAGAAGKLTGTVSSVGGAITRATGALSSVAGSVGGITNAVSSINNSVSSITGGIKSATNAITAIADAGTAVSSTINNLTAVASSLSNSATGSVLNTSTGSVENAMNSVGALAGAGFTGNNVALTNEASSVQQGASAATSSALASGLSNLPGGINTVSSVSNQATGAINTIPGIGSLTGAIKSASSAAMNGISAISAATGALSSIASKLGGVSNELGDAANKLGGLTALASTGLPVGALAQLESSIAALAGGTPGSIALPSVGFNTTDRTSITKQIGATLDDPGIPPPNFVGSIPDSAKSAIDDDYEKAQIEFKEAEAAVNAKLAELQVAFDEYKKLDGTLPQGDPRIAEAYQRYRDFSNSPEYLAIYTRYVEAIKGGGYAA